MEREILWKKSAKRRIVVLWSFTYIFVLLFLGFISYITLSGKTPLSNFLIGEVPGFISHIFLPKIYLPILLVIYLLTVVFFYFVVDTYHYKITEDKIYLEKGILNRIRKSIPFRQVTDVSYSQGILQRILGIYDLNIQTAGTESTEIVFQGIENPEEPKEIIMNNID